MISQVTLVHKATQQEIAHFPAITVMTAASILGYILWDHRNHDAFSLVYSWKTQSFSKRTSGWHFSNEGWIRFCKLCEFVTKKRKELCRIVGVTLKIKVSTGKEEYVVSSFSAWSSIPRGLPFSAISWTWTTSSDSWWVYSKHIISHIL